MSVLLELSLFPIDQGESVSAQVSRAVALIRASGVPHQLTPMGTILETEELGEALDLVRRCHDLLRADGCNRVYATIKIDSRTGPVGRMAGKVQSIESRLSTPSV